MTEQERVNEATRRRYRRLITVESALLLLTIAGCPGLLTLDIFVSWAAVVLGVLWLWHIIAIPICFFYLIGKPVVMTLSPLVPSAESKAFRKELRERPVLSDEEFYARYFKASDIPKDVPIRLRRALLELDPLIDRAIPSDLLYHLDDELDFADVLELTQQEFGIHFESADWDALDGTLDNLIRLVQRRIGSNPR